MQETFSGSFTQQTPIPESGITAATEVMRSGRLHRYNVAPGEEGETAAFEREFAAATGARHALAVASGGQAMAIALRAAGVGHGDPVLANAFTLAPVPGAIAAVGARPVLVETTEALTIDLDDLEAKLGQAPVVMVSHMRGHLCDMDRLMAMCVEAGVTVIEDCAHTMGAAWRGVSSGRHGLAGCYSTQTYKHINSGEGGLIVSDDADFMARATILSGSYMLYDRHSAGPASAVFGPDVRDLPNMSARMDNLRAALLRPQLADLPARCDAWTARYRVVEAGLDGTPGVALIARPPEEDFVGSSFQFRLPGHSGDAIAAIVAAATARGVDLKWFGASEPLGYTSRYDHWRSDAPVRLPRTDAILSTLLDMRLPLSFSLEDCAVIARILRDEIAVHTPRAAAE